MNVRKLLFNVIDRKNGSPVAKGIHDLSFQFDSGFTSADERKRDIVHHITDTVPYYRAYRGAELSELPVIEKRIIKENQERFVSDAYAAKLTSLRKATTSGSYGTPFTFYLNPEKRSRMIAEVYFFGSGSGFEVGRKHAYLVAKKKSKFQQFTQNQLMITVGKLDDSWCQSTVETLRKTGTKVVVGYASAIERLAIYLLSRSEVLEMDGVITISEVLSDEARSRIGKAFQSPAISRYSTEELGVLANQDTTGQFFYLNQANYFIEILKQDSEEPASVGELGRIVVTDYFNRSMPLVRYDIGDLATPLEIQNGLVTKIDRVEGRRLAVIRNVNGDVISSFQINGALRESQDIVQFQFSQEGVADYKLRAVVKQPIDEAVVVKLYKNILGDSARIQLEYVDDIPALPSGKRPYILQNYYQN